MTENALHGGDAGFAGAVRIVETGFQHAVVDCDNGERQRSGVLHGLERANAAGSLFRHADDVLHQFGTFHRGQSREARTIVDDDVRLDLIKQVECPLMRLLRRPIGIVCDGNALFA